jgi:hypothetical protein
VCSVGFSSVVLLNEMEIGLPCSMDERERSENGYKNVVRKTSVNSLQCGRSGHRVK